MQSPVCLRFRPVALAVVAMLSVSACHSLDPRPTALPAQMAGSWREDAAASDDFDSKLSAVIAIERRRLQPRHGAPVARGNSGNVTATEIEPLTMPQEEPDKERTRLADDLRPAAVLRIAFSGDNVEITRDAEPLRSFVPGQSVSRIDSSGAANVTSGWNGRAFEIHARYTSHATRSWRLELDGVTDTLRVSFEANDPEFGGLVMQTIYRRATEHSP